MAGWEDGGGEGVVLPLSFLCGGDVGWKWGVGVGVTGKCLLAFSPPLISKLKALTLYTSFAVSSNMLASLKLCLVCLSITGGSL